MAIPRRKGLLGVAGLANFAPEPGSSACPWCWTGRGHDPVRVVVEDVPEPESVITGEVHHPHKQPADRHPDVVQGRSIAMAGLLASRKQRRDPLRVEPLVLRDGLGVLVVVLEGLATLGIPAETGQTLVPEFVPYCGRQFCL